MPSKALSGSYGNLATSCQSSGTTLGPSASSYNDVSGGSMVFRERPTDRRWSSDVQGLLHRGGSATSLLDVIETDYLPRWGSGGPQTLGDEDVTREARRGSGVPMTDRKPSLPVPTPERPLDLASCVQVHALLTRALASPPREGGREAYRVVAPDALIARIAADVVRMSQCEPMGTAGCRLRVKLDRIKEITDQSQCFKNQSNPVKDGDECKAEIGTQQSINIETNTKRTITATTSSESSKNQPITNVLSSQESSDGLIAEIRLADSIELTSEVILSLKESEKDWHGLGHALSHALSCLGPASSRRGRVYISPAYRLEKIKLYTATR